jgi:hypothetical protein
MMAKMATEADMSNFMIQKENYKAILWSLGIVLNILQSISMLSNLLPDHEKSINDLEKQITDLLNNLYQFYEEMWDKDPRSTSPGWFSEN